ncbi:hypothetical protein BGZ93_001554 [Podila epicladia]|nr:hypothetical protein BGZ93_001554 [Podila epicladia]
MVPHVVSITSHVLVKINPEVLFETVVQEILAKIQEIKANLMDTADDDGDLAEVNHTHLCYLVLALEVAASRSRSAKWLRIRSADSGAAQDLAHKSNIVLKDLQSLVEDFPAKHKELKRNNNDKPDNLPQVCLEQLLKLGTGRYKVASDIVPWFHDCRGCVRVTVSVALAPAQAPNWPS